MTKDITSTQIKKKKENNEKIVFLTAYDYPSAKILEKTDIDGVLVGDSVGNTVLGYENTLPVSMDEMIHHTKAVSKGLDKQLLVSDMPFISYQPSPEEAVKNAGKLLKEGKSEAVKIEGGSEYEEEIKKVIKAGIPVMGHLGLTPQKIQQLDGYEPRGKSIKEAKQIFKDAKKLEELGVFSLVLESVPTELAEKITQELEIPTIGIGAGPKCDGQILVLHDLIGISEKKPKFVKNYANLSSAIENAVKEFETEVKEEEFPASENSYNMKEEVAKELKEALGKDD